MSTTAMLIAGVVQVCIAPVLIIARRPIAHWITDSVPPLDVAWFHVRGALFMTVGGIVTALSGGVFIGIGAATLASA